ncbi:MAG TPA: copper resistance protein CopC, partial [Actinomycetota bacterium]
WVAAGGLATGTRADAHAQLRSSVPADGELVQESPNEVVITFTEPPDPDLSTIRVLDSTGAPATSGPQQVDPDHRQMRAPVQDLADGVYTVSWRAVSQTDGHLTAGSYTFGIGVTPPPADEGGGELVTSSPSVLAVSGRAALYWGLSLLLAAGSLAVLMLGAGGVPRAIVASAWGMAALGIVLMIFAEANAVGVSVGSMVTTATGRPLVQQAIAIGVAGLGVAAYMRWRDRLPLAIASVAAAVAMLVHAGAGHAGAARSWRWFDVGVQWAHIVATGLWIGGLVWLLLTVTRLDGAMRTRAVTWFSAFAGLNLAVIVATGVARELDEIGGLGNLGSLLDTSFGVALLIKTGLFVVLVLFAARNRFRNVPRLRNDPSNTRSVARTVAAELVVAVGVLGVTGALSQLPPPVDLQQTSSRASDRVVVRGSDFATTLKAELTVTPGTVGPNRFELELTDFDTGEPVDATRAALDFSFPERPELASRLELEEEGPGSWSANGTQLALNGSWEVRALVETGTDSVEVALELRTRRPPQDIQVTTQEGQPTVYTIRLDGGSSVQSYVDPGKEGPNNVHFTFFDDAGGEFAVRDLTATATSPDGEIVELETREFSPGHYVSNAELEAGRWEFDFSGRGPGDQTVSGYFAHTIDP